MNRKIIKIFFVLSVFFAAPFSSQAAVYFEWNSAEGYKYLGSSNSHAGGGYFNWMGGAVTKPEGTGCQDPNNFHNTFISTDSSAFNSDTGSSTALKTPYSGSCPNESFTRDTTIIRTPLLSEYYIRWNQKWTGSFQASVQQKFAKFYNSADSTSSTLTAHLSMRPNNSSGLTPGATTGLFENYTNNIDSHFTNQTCTNAAVIWLAPAPVIGNGLNSNGTPNCYNGQAKGYDDSILTETPITLELDRWYTIEIHSKLNSSPSVSDGVYEVWIDGALRLAGYDFKFKDGVTYNTPGTNNFEFQHVYYNRSAQDQSTYMDNIIISDHYNGPYSSLDVVAPASPSSMSVQ